MNCATMYLNYKDMLALQLKNSLSLAVTFPFSTMTVQFHPAPPQSDSSVAFADGPRLLADIGGTNARFALETGARRDRR